MQQLSDGNLNMLVELGAHRRLLDKVTACTEPAFHWFFDFLLFYKDVPIKNYILPVSLYIEVHDAFFLQFQTHFLIFKKFVTQPFCFKFNKLAFWEIEAQIIIV